MRGIRLRSTAIAASVVAVALLVGGIALMTILRNRLLANLDDTLTAQAMDRAALIETGADPQDLTTTLIHETVVWIGTADGSTIATGGRLEIGSAPPIRATGTATLEASYVETSASETSETEREEVRFSTVEAISPADTMLLVSVGREIEVVDNPVRRIRTALLLGSPLVIALVAAITWLTVDRTLRPVESIRATAASIGGRGLDRRVPVPATRDEVERLAVTVNGMLDRLAAHADRQRQFIGDASHELKSPLAILRADLETRSSTDRDWPDVRRGLIAQVERLGAIVDDLLVLAADDERESIARVPVDLDDIIFDEIARVRDARPDVRIVLDEVSPVRVSGDPSRLRRATRNLIENAQRHAHGVVAVSVANAAGAATVEIRDDGPGISPDDRERVFARFLRLDDARARDAGGTGLGLAILRQIVQRHGGSVDIDDAPEGGTLVRLRLPMA